MLRAASVVNPAVSRHFAFALYDFPWGQMVSGVLARGNRAGKAIEVCAVLLVVSAQQGLVCSEAAAIWVSEWSEFSVGCD
jgi:hypothetical protein